MYLITGATGNVGSSVAGSLIERGDKVRVLVRNPEKVEQWKGRVEVATGDLANSNTFRDALSGIDAVFLMNRGPDKESFQAFVDRAKTEGCQKIVFLSSLAANNPELSVGRMHKEKEDVIRASGLAGFFVRPGGFMSNAYQWIPSIKAESVVHNPMGAGQYAPVAPEDIAAVAVHVLTSDGSTEEILEVTGGELLSVPRQVEILSRLLGSQIRCVDISPDSAVQQMVQSGLPKQVAEAVAESAMFVRKGAFADVKETVAKVTGRAPKTFERWASERRAMFA
jgi:uncharacterized protein YbjT (DUF2867 family)